MEQDGFYLLTRQVLPAMSHGPRTILTVYPIMLYIMYQMFRIYKVYCMSNIELGVGNGNKG